MLGPLSVGVITFCVWAITEKDDLFGYGLGGGDETAALKVGVYVTLAGGILALIAAIAAALPSRTAPEPTMDAPLEGSEEPPSAHLDL